MIGSITVLINCSQYSYLWIFLGIALFIVVCCCPCVCVGIWFMMGGYTKLQESRRGKRDVRQQSGQFTYFRGER